MYLIITLLFLVAIGYLYRDKAFAVSFVDEEYNFAIGKYLLKNEVLYDDIITNHQPITHIFSALIQKYTKPNSAFLLLTRHREFIIFWSIIWSLVFVFYFGLGALIFIILYELTKSYLLGNLFLSEAIVVYPLLFLVGLIICNKQKLGSFQLIFSGICIALSALLLGPIWLLIGCLIFLLLYGQKHYFTKTLLYITLGVLIVIALVWRYTSIPGYFYYYLYTNLNYTVPNYHNSYYNETWAITISKAFSTPILSFMKAETTPTLLVTKILSLLIVTHLIFLLIKKRFRQTIIIILLLGLGNIRFVSPGNEHYNGFHLLPWYAVLIFISSVVSVEHLKKNRPAILKVISIALIVTATTLSIKYGGATLITKRDIQRDFLVNYSTHIDRGEIIKIIKQPDDTLFVSPDAWLIYWQSDTNHLPKLFGYYPWMAGIPKLHSKVLEAFTNRPPTFFYCDNCKGLELEKFLKQYSEVKKNNGSTRLYILQSKIQALTEAQLNQLKFYDVKFTKDKE